VFSGILSAMQYSHSAIPEDFTDASIPTATDYADVEKLIEQTNRRHDVLSAIARWRMEFRLFKQTQGRIGLNENDEAEKNSYLAIVRKIKGAGHRILEAIDANGIDTERECGIRLDALRACVEEIEDDEGMLSIPAKTKDKLDRYFGVK